MARFAGSESYGSSYAETAFNVVEAVVEPVPEYPQPIDNTMTIIGTGIVLLIAIVIVGMLLFRKRP